MRFPAHGSRILAYAANGLPSRLHLAGQGLVSMTLLLPNPFHTEVGVDGRRPHLRDGCKTKKAPVVRPHRIIAARRGYREGRLSPVGDGCGMGSVTLVVWMVEAAFEQV